MPLRLITAEIFFYALFMAFVIMEDPLLMIGFAVVILGLFLGIFRFYREGWQRLKIDFRQHLKAAVGLAFILAGTFPFLMANDIYWLQVLNLAIMYAVMALGLNLMTGQAGLICLGYAAFVAIGAYVVGILTLKIGISFWVALLAAGLVAGLFGIVLGLPALRVKGHYLALLTIAFGLIVQEIILNWESLTGGTNGLINIPTPVLFGYDFGTPLQIGSLTLPFQVNFYFFNLILLALTMWIVYRLSESFIGLAFNAMREDQLAARCYGMKITSYKLVAFALGAFFGGIVGGVYAGMINFVAPQNFGYQQSILVLSMVIFGGLDSIPGAIIGAVFLTVFPEKFRAFEDYRLLFYGLVIVLSLLFLPEGVLPFRHRVFQRPSDGRGEERLEHENA